MRRGVILESYAIGLALTLFAALMVLVGVCV